MPVIETRRCKRHGTLEAKRIRIRIFEVGDDGGDEVVTRQDGMLQWEEDLSDRAIKEIAAKIAAGIKPPVKQKTKEGGGDGK